MGIEEKRQITQEYKDEYSKWKKQCLTQKQGYFIIFNSFVEGGILKEVREHSALFCNKGIL